MPKFLSQNKRMFSKNNVSSQRGTVISVHFTHFSTIINDDLAVELVYSQWSQMSTQYVKIFYKIILPVESLNRIQVAFGFGFLKPEENSGVFKCIPKPMKPINN